MNSGKLYDLKTILGHSDLKTTERYAHLSKDHFASVKDIIQPKISEEINVIGLRTHCTIYESVEIEQENTLAKCRSN